MKTLNALALVSVLVSATLAVPVPVREGEERNFHFQRPDTHRSWSHSLYSPLDQPPLPGRSGHHTENRLTTIHYGDDHLPGHMRHLERNQARYPENRNPMELAHHSDRNRRNALHHIPTRQGRVRDEKLPNMFHNPNHARTTTVEYRDPHESHREGALLSGAKAQMLSQGKGARGQLRANPGWLPLHPDQRRGHEAPAKLHTHTFDKQELHHVAKKHSTAKVPLKHSSEGYSPITQSGMLLRHRKGQDAPPVHKTPTSKRATGSGTNLQKGTPAKPLGHVFHGTSEMRPKHPSHFGAPAPPSNSHQRNPPRPQDRAHHEKMQEVKRRVAQNHGGPSQAHHPVTGSTGSTHSNLERLNREMSALRVGDGHSRTSSAPAHLGTHHRSSNSHSSSISHNSPVHGTHQHSPQAPHKHIPLRPASPHTPTPKGKQGSQK